MAVNTGRPRETNGRNFVPKRDLTRYCNANTRLLVQRDNSLPGAVLAGFAPLGARVVLLPVEVAAEGRLGL